MPTNFHQPKSKAYPVMLHLILKPPKNKHEVFFQIPSLRDLHSLGRFL